MLQRSKARPRRGSPVGIALQPGPGEAQNRMQEQVMTVVSEAKLADVKKLVNDAAATGAPKAQKLAGEAAAPVRNTVEKQMEQATKATEGFMKAAEQAAEFGRGNAEAVAKSAQVYMTGVQDLSKQTLALMQALSEQAIANAKALATVKSLKEATEIQTSYARTTVEKMLADTTKLQEASLKLAEATFAPITARVQIAVETMSKPLAV
ncbi:phasin family protein [Belnapia sp. T6]|uniref:Phasin family protein n=1 Tax=Belnapia mucosa TaxID=2804532 RepID=A0ABS1V9X4_9PROT|nr:phasin family protein [Belnapia mucosa]MBL6458450.1 phasin family protein [Belnapia mucosa]